MNESRPLHDLYERYQNGEIDRSTLESAIFSFVRSNPRRFRLGDWSEDDRDEFIADLYPTIRKSIDGYRDIGSCFDAYAYSTIRWEAKGFRCRRAEEATFEQTYWRTMGADLSQDEAGGECVRDVSETRREPPPGVSRKKRQILALTLKCCLYVSEDFCGKIAPTLGMTKDDLESKLNGLRARLAERALRRSELEERAAAFYYRGIVMETKAASAPMESEKKRRFEKSAAVAKDRHRKLRQRASRISTEATNREVAEALNVPKGTIDASLYFLKRRSDPLHDPSGSRV